jgi:lipoprotein-anchoring transpeptidase ErfK/SrfK
MASQSEQRPERKSPIPAEVWVPADSSGNSRSGWPSTGKLLLAGFFTLSTFALLGFAIILALLFFYSDMILPGVYVLDVNVGSMNRAEAAAVLQDRWQQQVSLEHSDGTWLVGAADLGISLDVEATVEDAYAQGRSFDSVLSLLQGGLHAQPVWSFDAAAAVSSLAAFVPQLSIPPINAGVRIEQGNVLETDAADGRALDMDMTMAYLTADPTRVLMTGRLPLATQPVPPAVTDVSKLAAEARRLLSATLTLHAYDPVADETTEWIITPQSWGTWLSLRADPDDAERFEWVIDEGAAELYLDTQLPGLGEERYLDGESLIPALMTAISTQQPAVSTRIFHHPRQHTVQSGETLAGIGRTYGIPYPWIQQANPGSEFLQAGDTITIPSTDEMLPFPVIQNKRIVINISQQTVLVYEDGQTRWEWPASTGIDSSPTAPGIFQIQSHEPNAYASNWDLWMPSFMGIYRPLPTADFMNGFHGFPTRNGSTLLWTGDLGHQVTYGCILLSSENASLLYDWAEEGVVVEVLP